MVSAKKTEQTWPAALRKVREEGKCRNCGKYDGKLEAAHTINRALQDEEKPDLVNDNGQWGYGAGMHRWVNPASIVPLCQGCHMLYDAHKLDILPILSNEEQANAVKTVGIARAYQRLTSNKEVI